MRSGFVAIIGRPNVGKSTLINSIIGKKIAITSNKPQTTRHMIQGIYHGDNTQIIFVDTPGIHKPKHKLGKFLNKQAYFSIEDVDIILFLVDAREKMGLGDQFILEKLKDIEKPVFLIINKIDAIPKPEILPKIVEYKDAYNFAEIIPVSATKKENIDRLITTLTKYLKDEIKYFEDDQITNVSREFMISELVREKVLTFTEEEVPHAVTCIVESIERIDNLLTVRVAIIVERDGLKKIVVGKNGSMIKDIGIAARADIEDLLGEKIYLDLFVKTINKWRDKEKYLTELGYQDFKA